jgi:predicted acyltransferase
MPDDSKPKRLFSLDALRGFDMLMISGGGLFIYLMHGKTDFTWLNIIAANMEHPGWLEPITFYDFIFPLFLFISGISLAFSINSHLGKGYEKNDMYKKVFKRMIILMILGLIYKNSPINIYDPAHIRYSSVLGRIGMATFFTTFLYLTFSLRTRLLWVAGILLTYYAAMFLIPVPGYGAGNFTMEGNLAGWIDRTIMPGRLINGVYDENALATSLPAWTLTVLGAWAGDILLNVKNSENKKALTLLGIGAGLLILGLIWGLHFPIVKKLWSSSFILVTAGASFMAMAVFYWLIDIKGWHGWAFPFRVIGLNSLVIYLTYHFINFRYTSHKLFSGFYGFLDKGWIEVLDAFGATVLVWLFLYFLYKKQWFWKI